MRPRSCASGWWRRCIRRTPPTTPTPTTPTGVTPTTPTHAVRHHAELDHTATSTTPTSPTTPSARARARALDPSGREPQARRAPRTRTAPAPRFGVAAKPKNPGATTASPLSTSLDHDTTTTPTTPTSTTATTPATPATHDAERAGLHDRPAAGPAAAQPAEHPGPLDLGRRTPLRTGWQKPATYQCPSPGHVAAKQLDVPSQPLIACDSSGNRYLLGPAVVEGTDVTERVGRHPAGPDRLRRHAVVQRVGQPGLRQATTKHRDHQHVEPERR